MSDIDHFQFFNEIGLIFDLQSQSWVNPSPEYQKIYLESMNAAICIAKLESKDMSEILFSGGYRLPDSALPYGLSIEAYFQERTTRIIEEGQYPFTEEVFEMSGEEYHYIFKLIYDTWYPFGMPPDIMKDVTRIRFTFPQEKYSYLIYYQTQYMGIITVEFTNEGRIVSHSDKFVDDVDYRQISRYVEDKFC